MNSFITSLACAASVFARAAASAQTDRPSIVLVHGAFADTSSWNGVIGVLQKDGYFVVAHHTC
jgi:alpha-beta hydrolase superfamily lysophospholipase